MNPNKVIILAGGLSSRLYPITNNKPKCMLEVNGKSIIQRQRNVFKDLGINKIIVVTGYYGKVINENHTDLIYVHEPEESYKVPGIVKGLFHAEKEMQGGFIFSYSDIIYGQDIAEKLLEVQGDIVIVVDTEWKKHYKGRTKHPLSEAELVKSRNGRVTKIGKDVVKIDEAQGEFIGLAKFTDKGAKIIKEVYRDLRDKHKPEDSFQNAKEFQRAYLTDLIQELVDRKIEVKTADITSVWTEIDTDQDLERAKKIWK